ncbi:hypothetical protein MKW94_017927 [Papaver nudicaule]|uniref:Protein SCAR n=1 Tax=Papaver nudicaule TaxID=74823 RepID=A0AA41RMX2_PAPNU|nr:hypothetical protein [Papaver nudicaule]
MPLVRFEVKNEYGLGSEEMYRKRGGSDEDPKSILEGLTVAGLVGILRQLGDLAEFASEIFHDLQEEVMETAARSHKMIARVNKLEESIPPIEKAILAQKSHIHFAYIDGIEWHPKIQTRKNQIVYSYLPRFIMDTYEECRDPPDFHVLDKFDKGGPGSCVRRYSDPSYFKRALANSEMLSGVKGQREKKAQKSRKKGGRQRNGGLSYSVSASGRIQSGSPTSYSESSVAETNSTVNMRSKSELGDRSKYFDPRIMEVRATSLDLRTKLGYHEYVFDGNSSNQHEDQDDSELSSPRSNLQTDGTGSILAEEREKSEYDGLSNRSSLAPSVRKSSSVTWDEKIEIMKPMHQKLHGLRRNVEKDSNALPLRSDLTKLEKRSPTRSNIGAVPTLSDFVKISGSVFYDNESDELESEADSYVDALNTMESEVDTDVDRQTKQEVELSFAKFKNEGIKDYKEAPTCESNARMSESSDVETDTASYTSSNKQVPRNLSKSIDSEDLSYVQPLQVNNIISGNDPSSSGSNIPNSEGPLVGENVNQSGEYDETQAPAPSVTFWTNGGLLGLQPSKPPDYRETSTEIKCRSGTKNDIYTISSETCVSKSQVKAREHEEKNHDWGRCYDGSEDDTSAPFEPLRKKLEDGLSKKNPVSVAKIEKSGDSHYNNVVQGNGLSETSRLKAGLVKLQDHHIRQEGRNRVAYQTSPEKNLKKLIDSRSPMNSACSSPPLEHMKISVHPMNVSETSFLKLKFPDGKHLHESSEDTMFPTFQLLPELSNSLQGIGDESDDDTFYRSSPDMSEEHMSQCSASNSDQWDSDEIPGASNQDPKLYDSLRRVPSDESVSSLLEHEGKIANDDDTDTYRKPDRISDNLSGIQSMPDGPVLNCQSFDVASQLTSKHERKVDSYPKDDLDLLLQYSSIPTPMPRPDELAPPLPPLPPLEWRLVKLPAQENEEAFISKAAGGLRNLQVSEATPIQQPKLNQSEKTPVVITAAPPYSQHKQHTLGRSVTMQDSNGKDLNERQDLLHQIRSKSFNLRRTVPARPDLITGPTSNNKVAEMLQKANAIRQAFVGSDDGEDGSWSES